MDVYVYMDISVVYTISCVHMDFSPLTYRILNYFDLMYDVSPYGSNAIYFSLYGLLCPCMT